MAELDRTSFLAFAKAKEPQRVELPDGAWTHVRIMGGEERDQFEDLVYEKKMMSSFRTWLVVKCMCGEDGKRILSDHEYKSVAALPATTLEPIWRAAAKINRLLKADVDELVGNSPSATSGASGSSSHCNGDVASESANTELETSSPNGSPTTGLNRSERIERIGEMLA